MILFTDAFTCIDWHEELLKSPFYVMPYPASFVRQKEIDRDLFIFSQNNGDMAVVAKQTEDQPTGCKPAPIPPSNTICISYCIAVVL